MFPVRVMKYSWSCAKIFNCLKRMARTIYSWLPWECSAYSPVRHRPMFNEEIRNCNRLLSSFLSEDERSFMCFSQFSLTALKCFTPTVTLYEIVICTQIINKTLNAVLSHKFFVRIIYYIIIYEEWNDKLKIFQFFQTKPFCIQ